MQPYYEDREYNVQVGSLGFSFPAHLHAHVEIAHVFSGSLRMAIDGREYTLSPGDTGVAFPNHVHAYQESGDVSGVMVIFPAEISADFGRVLLTQRPKHPILPAARAHEDISAILRAIERERGGAQSEIALRAYIQVVLARLVPALAPEKSDGEDEHGVLFDILRYLGHAFDRPITMDELARAFGVSKYHISHLFSARLGVRFRAYLNALRVERARLLLTGTALSITQICYECGFENQRTFNRAFLTFCGMTPTRFRESVKA